MSVEIEILTTTTCRRCERANARAAAVVEKVAREFPGLKWKVVDLTASPDAAARYGVISTPAIAVNGKVVFNGIPRQKALRRKLLRQMEPSAAGEGAIEKTQLKIDGMMCSFCAQTIEKAMMRTRGVRGVNVSLAHEEVLIKHDPAIVSSEEIKGILRGLGYTVRDSNKAADLEEEDKRLVLERNRMIFGWTFAVAVTLMMVLNWLDTAIPRQKWITFGMATLVLFGGGAHILQMSLMALRRGIFNQHVLLTFGALGAYASGVLGFFYMIPDFFPAAIYLTAFHLLSGYLSGLVRTKSSRAVRKLLSLQPLTAHLVKDGLQRDVPVEELNVGDMVRVLPGERIPVDGVIVDGTSTVDQSMVTGEPIPVDRAPGDEVIGGSLNQLGSLLVRVTKVGEETFLQQVARYVEEAKALKPGIIILADRVLGIYVPSVMVISVLSFLYWYIGVTLLGGRTSVLVAVYAALSVLIIGYPCALGMATPLALIRGSGIGARRGILMRSGEAFQTMKDVTRVILDKTGTITQGRPVVQMILPLGGWSAMELLETVASVEARSEHPLARAITEEAQRRGLALKDVTSFQVHPGFGVEAELDGTHVIVGNGRLLKSRGIELGEVEAQMQELEQKGMTVIVSSVGGRVSGLIGIWDPPKADAAEAIRDLKDRGMTPIMITGDNPRAAAAIARLVGIGEVMAQVLPHQKAERLREIQSQGHRVAMVGDGINDAPALMQADIGIAIGAGTDIAIESSDVILVRGDLKGVLDAFDLSINTYRKIRQNLIWAFLFNGVGIPVAATGILHPLMAMAAMVLSTTAIMLNSFASRFVKDETPARPEVLRIFVPDIHCSRCVDRIRQEILSTGAILRVKGEPSRKIITIEFTSGGITKERIKEAIKAVGYSVAES
jgi:heavy metal translocating P-type ATPase